MPTCSGNWWGVLILVFFSFTIILMRLLSIWKVHEVNLNTVTIHLLQLPSMSSGVSYSENLWKKDWIPGLACVVAILSTPSPAALFD